MKNQSKLMPHILLAAVLGAFGGSKDNGPDRKPTGQELRDPSDPHQRERIAAAAQKRERRAAKRAINHNN